MRKIFFYCVLISVFLHSPAFSKTVTMDDFLSRVRQSHPFFRKEVLSPDIERRRQERFLGDEDWVLLSNPYYAHEENAKSGDFTPAEIDQAGINVVLEKTYWKTGGRLSLSYDYSKTDQEADDIVIPLSGSNIAIPGDSGTFHENAFTLTYSHPLLQNRGGVLSRLDYELQEYNVSAADLSAAENQENFLLDAGDRFLDWVLLDEQRRILYRRHELAKEESDRTVRKRKQNLVDEVDVIRARDAVLSAEQNVLQAEAGWKARREELATMAQYRVREDIVPQYDLYETVTMPSVDNALARLKQNSRVLNVFRIRMEQLDHRKKGVMEQGRPQLDLSVSGGLKGGDEQYNESYDYDRPQFMASLNFSYPLGNRTARADILRAGLERDRVREDMKNVGLELESSLRNLMTRIKELEKILALNREQIIVAREKTRAEMKRYNQGRIELTFVIQSRDNEQNVQLIYAHNAALYHKLVLRYRALTDGLFPSGL